MSVLEVIEVQLNSYRLLKYLRVEAITLFLFCVGTSQQAKFLGFPS